MAIFNSYVKLPEGIYIYVYLSHIFPWVFHVPLGPSAWLRQRQGLPQGFHIQCAECQRRAAWWRGARQGVHLAKWFGINRRKVEWEWMVYHGYVHIYTIHTPHMVYIYICLSINMYIYIYILNIYLYKCTYMINIYIYTCYIYIYISIYM